MNVKEYQAASTGRPTEGSSGRQSFLNGSAEDGRGSEPKSKAENKCEHIVE